MALALTSCSVANLSYAEVDRDLGALMQIDTAAGDRRLRYADDVAQSAWYARWVLLAPFKPVLLWLLPDTQDSELENPSEQARLLLRQVAPKAGDDLLRGAVTLRKLVLVLELDTSALNKIAALDGLAQLAVANGFNVLMGLDLAEQRLQPAAELQRWINEFLLLRPQARADVTVPLREAEAAQYRALLETLSAQPLPDRDSRVALVNELATASVAEPDRALQEATVSALRTAMRHAIQWELVMALRGQSPALVHVRIRALEILHQQGGPDCVPLLLSLLISTAEQKRDGAPDFDPHPLMELRLIHLCGQLDEPRALRTLRLPGREAWQAVAPAEFLARIVLREGDLLAQPTQLPAREALARCLGRKHIGLGDDPVHDEADWVATWLDDFLGRQGQR